MYLHIKEEKQVISKEGSSLEMAWSESKGKYE